MMDDVTALVEAVLYLETNPIALGTLARVTSLEETVVQAAIEALEKRYAAADSGLEILRVGGGFMLSPKKGPWEVLKERYGKKNDAKLSRAAMETLAIIAYSQPITRAEIEQIRGVQADNMIRLLVERDLVRETGKKDVPGKPAQYGTTKEFLQFFHINSIADLPKLGETDSDRFELAAG